MGPMGPMGPIGPMVLMGQMGPIGPMGPMCPMDGQTDRRTDRRWCHIIALQLVGAFLFLEAIIVVGVFYRLGGLAVPT